MPPVDGAWSREQLRTFLEEALVPIRLGCHDTRGGLWMLSLWYRYRDGRFRCATGGGSDIAGFLRADDAVSFEVSTNAVPYMGVRGNGTATLAPDEDKQLLEGLLERYLGGTDSALARSLLDEGREEVAITIEPDRLYTWDFSGRMAGLADAPATDPEPGPPEG